MKASRHVYGTNLLAGASLLAFSFGAAAQDADSDQLVLEEIIVTAQKREQSLQDVPISISSLQGDKVQNFAAGGEDIRLLSSRIPGLNAESSNGRLAPRFYIRGLGNTDFDLAASQPVSIVVDEIVQENVVLKSFPLFDLQRVEVLRGPQGTLFGRNTPAGIVKFDTVKPSQEFSAYVNAGYGTRNTTSVEAAVGGGISDTLSIRVSGLYQSRSDTIDVQNTSGLTEDALGGFEEFAGRVQLLFEPTDNFSALANVHFRDNSGTSALFRANILDTGSNDLNENFDRDTVFFDNPIDNPQEAQAWGASLRLEYDINDNTTLTSLTGYETAENSSFGDIDGGNPSGPGFIPFQSATRDGLDDLDQFTQELRLSGQATDQIFYQVGFFYFDSDLTIRTEPFFVPDTLVRQQNDAWAVFGQITYDLTDNTTFTGGIRYTEDDRTADAFSGAFGAQLPQVAVSGNRVSWDAALNHDLNDDWSIYARVASGFRAPSIQSRDVAFFGVPTVAEEETIISYEAGFKANLVENRLRWNGSIFYYDVSDLQVTAVGGVDNNIALINVEEAIGFGFETDIEFLVSESFTLATGVAYTNTEINDPNLRVPVCGSGQCTPLDPLDEDGFAFVDGNPLPQAPEWTVNATADYHIPVGDDGELFAFADFALQGFTNLLIYEAVEFSTSGTFELGLRVGYRWNNGQYEFAGFVRNLTNEANLRGVIDFNNNTGFVNEPRIWGVQFLANF